MWLSKATKLRRFFLQQGADKLTLVIDSQARLTARYNTIRQVKNYIEMMPPLITSPFPKYQLLMKAAELERIEAISDIS